MSLLDEFLRIMRALPPHPVSPENRGFAKLQASAFVARGLIYRLDAQPHLTGDHRPRILINADDLTELRTQFRPPFRFVDIDQDIADIAEQVFALQEVRAGR